MKTIGMIAFLLMCSATFADDKSSHQSASKVVSQAVPVGEGRTIEIDVLKHADGTTIQQRLLGLDNATPLVNCTVTCHSTGKSYSWTCPSGKSCEGDCSNPDKPTGRCY